MAGEALDKRQPILEIHSESRTQLEFARPRAVGTPGITRIGG